MVLEHVDLLEEHFTTGLLLLVDLVCAQSFDYLRVDLGVLTLSLFVHFGCDLLVVEVELADRLQLLDVRVHLHLVRLLKLVTKQKLDTLSLRLTVFR